jgi:hypothetical protein
MLASITFAQDVDLSLIPYRSGDKWGYSSPEKNILITPKYDDAAWFSEGYAAVKIGNKWGYINKAGKLVIPAKYTVAKSFRKGYLPNASKSGGDSILFAGASLQASGYEVCINTKGVTLTKCPAIPENSVAQNRIPIQTIITQKTYSIPNNNGLFDKIENDYKIEGNNETYYIAQKGGMYGVFNSKFDTIVPFTYNAIELLKSGDHQYLKVTKDGKSGLLAPAGAVIVNPENTNLNLVNTSDNVEYVIVQHDGKSYVKDMKNNDFISRGYSDIVYDDGGFIVTADNKLKGYYFLNNTSIAPKYTEVKRVNGGKYLQVKTFAGKTGYISAAGNEYFVE